MGLENLSLAGRIKSIKQPITSEADPERKAFTTCRARYNL